MYIEDAVDAYDKVLMDEGNPGRDGINFGSGSEVSVNEIAELVMKHAEVNLQPIHVEPRPVEVERLFADISKAYQTIRFQARSGF